MRCLAAGPQIRLAGWTGRGVRQGQTGATRDQVTKKRMKIKQKENKDIGGASAEVLNEKNLTDKEIKKDDEEIGESVGRENEKKKEKNSIKKYIRRCYFGGDHHGERCRCG